MINVNHHLLCLSLETRPISWSALHVVTHVTVGYCFLKQAYLRIKILKYDIKQQRCWHDEDHI